jgi:hypothetical protein
MTATRGHAVIERAEMREVGVNPGVRDRQAAKLVRIKADAAQFGEDDLDGGVC